MREKNQNTVIALSSAQQSIYTISKTELDALIHSKDFTRDVCLIFFWILRLFRSLPMHPQKNYVLSIPAELKLDPYTLWFFLLAQKYMFI